MADEKISQMPGAVTPLDGTEVVPLLQGGANVRATTADIAKVNGPGGSANEVQVNNGSGGFGGLTNVQLTALINAFTDLLSGAVPASGGGVSNFLRADGSWHVPPSVPGGANGQVQVNSAGVFSGLTTVQLTALINNFTSLLSGAVPASGGGTANFLRADGTWASPTGTIDIPQNLQNANYQLVLGDRGKHLYHNDANPYTWTIPTNATVAFPVGTVVTLVNLGAGVITVAPAGGVTLHQMGTANVGNRTMAQNGQSTILKVEADIWTMAGVGVT